MRHRQVSVTRILFLWLFVSSTLLFCCGARAADDSKTTTCYDYNNKHKLDQARRRKRQQAVNLEVCDVIYFDRVADKLWYSGAPPRGWDPSLEVQKGHKEWTSAILASKVWLTGTLLSVKLDSVGLSSEQCTNSDWKIETQAKESANVLIFGPSDSGPGICSPDHYFIALPVHVLWAEVSAFPAQTDPMRKAPTSYAEKTLGTERECSISLALCDRHIPPFSYFYKTRSVYNLATQPGSSQGTISYSPVIGGGGNPKLTYDVQLNSAAQVGRGWLGVPLLFEKDSNPSANLDTLLVGLSYDLRSVIQQNVVSTPHFTIRKPQYQFRSLVEFAPTVSLPSQSHDLNVVEAELVRLPFIFNFNRQPSALAITPVLGLEEGSHVQTHLAEGDHILRGLAGGDVSYLWSYNILHNILGDKPITLAFSYRVRWLASPEPFTDVANKGAEIASTGTRSYWRASVVEPLSSYLQFKVSVQHGGLPPDFRMLAYSLNLGLTFTNPGSSEY